MTPKRVSSLLTLGPPQTDLCYTLEGQATATFHSFSMEQQTVLHLSLKLFGLVNNGSKIQIITFVSSCLS